MSRTTKIVLGVVAGILVLCICVAVAGVIALNRIGKAAQAAFSTDPASLATAASGVADFTLPPGYTGNISMKLLGITMVGYSRDDGDQIMLLMQLPAGANMEPAEMERQLTQAMSSHGYGSSGTNMQVVDQYPISIRGRTVTATVSEGTGSDGSSARQLTAVFEGKRGLGMIMIIGPTTTWDKSEIDAFLASMR